MLPTTMHLQDNKKKSLLGRSVTRTGRFVPRVQPRKKVLVPIDADAATSQELLHDVPEACAGASQQAESDMQEAMSSTEQPPVLDKAAAVRQAHALASQQLQSLVAELAGCIRWVRQSETDSSGWECDTWAGPRDVQHTRCLLLMGDSYSKQSIRSQVDCAVDAVDKFVQAWHEADDVPAAAVDDDDGYEDDYATLKQLYELLNDVTAAKRDLCECLAEEQLDAAEVLQDSVQQLFECFEEYSTAVLRFAAEGVVGSSSSDEAAFSNPEPDSSQGLPSSPRHGVASPPAAARSPFQALSSELLLRPPVSPATALLRLPPPAVGSPNKRTLSDMLSAPGSSGADRYDSPAKSGRMALSPRQQQAAMGYIAGLQGASAATSSALAAAAPSSLVGPAEAAAAAAAAEEEARQYVEELRHKIMLQWQKFWPTRLIDDYLQGDEWLFLMKHLSAFPVKGVDVEAAFRHKIVLGQPATKTAHKLLDKSSDPELSSTRLLDELLQRLQDADIPVAKHTPLKCKLRESGSNPDDLVGYDCSLVIDLPFASKQANAPTWQKHVPTSQEDKFRQKQQPGTPRLRVHISSTAKLADVLELDKSLPAGLKRLEDEGRLAVSRESLAHLRRLLVWQLTREEYEGLEVILGARLWKVWQDLAPLPPPEAADVGRTLTAVVNNINLASNNNGPQKQQQPTEGQQQQQQTLEEEGHGGEEGKQQQQQLEQHTPGNEEQQQQQRLG